MNTVMWLSVTVLLSWSVWEEWNGGLWRGVLKPGLPAFVERGRGKSRFRREDCETEMRLMGCPWKSGALLYNHSQQ